jgi:hypothetical protein
MYEMIVQSLLSNGDLYNKYMIEDFVLRIL